MTSDNLLKLICRTSLQITPTYRSHTEIDTCHVYACRLIWPHLHHIDIYVFTHSLACSLTHSLTLFLHSPPLPLTYPPPTPLLLTLSIHSCTFYPLTHSLIRPPSILTRPPIVSHSLNPLLSLTHPFTHSLPSITHPPTPLSLTYTFHSLFHPLPIHLLTPLDHPPTCCFTLTHPPLYHSITHSIHSPFPSTMYLISSNMHMYTNRIARLLTKFTQINKFHPSARLTTLPINWCTDRLIHINWCCSNIHIYWHMYSCVTCHNWLKLISRTSLAYQ